MTNEELVRGYYKGFERKEWSALEPLLADSFTFTSPNGDDHIDKAEFHNRCWPQSQFIVRFDLEQLVVRENDAFVMYLCLTTKGTMFRNVEYFRFEGGKITVNECYFGGAAGYPSKSIAQG